MRIVIQIVLAALIAVLGYLVFQSINKPMEFEKIKKRRDNVVIEKLKDIRSAQEAYKLANGKYTGSFDTLANYVKTGFVPLIKRTGTLTDEMLADGINEAKAIKKGLIKIDTIKVGVMDTIFKNRPKFNPDRLGLYVVGGKEKKITMGAVELPSESGLPIPLFEAKVYYTDMLEDLRNGDYNEEFRSDTMELNRLKKFIGWKVGSMLEANNSAGNWE